jgi:hypothetical protein
LPRFVLRGNCAAINHWRNRRDDDADDCFTGVTRLIAKYAATIAKNAIDTHLSKY